MCVFAWDSESLIVNFYFPHSVCCIPVSFERQNIAVVVIYVNCCFCQNDRVKIFKNISE